MRDPKLNALFNVVDPLLPIMRLRIKTVLDAYESYKHQLHQQHDINRVFLHVEEVLIFFSPYDVDILRPLLGKLVEKSPKGESLIPLVDVFTVLTLFVQGELADKGAFLFELYNLSKQDILSETEHALMIFRMSRSLQKIGILGRLDFTMDDVKHAAFLARYIPESDKFVAGINVEELTAWLTDSNVGKAASSFIAVLTRLLKVCIQMDGKASSLLTWLHEMQEHRQFDLPVPKMDLSQADLHKSEVFVVYRSSQQVSFALSTALLHPDELYIQVNKHMKFSKTSEKFYKLISYRRVPLGKWSGNFGQYSRVDVAELDPDSEYSFNMYQLETKLRYPAVSVKTLTTSGLTSRFESFCDLHISPALLSPEAIAEIVRNIKISKHSTLLYTGNICSIEEPLRRALSFAKTISVGSEVPRLEFASLVSLVETHFSTNWEDGMKTLFGLVQCSTSLHEDLSSVCAFDKSLMTIPCGVDILLSSLNEIKSCDSELKNAIKGLYMRYARASVPPTSVIPFGSRRIFNVGPFAGSPQSHPAAHLGELILFLEEDNLLEKSNVDEIIILCESPLDIAISEPRFKPKSTVSTGDLPEEHKAESTDDAPVRRGKHELIHGAHYGTPEGDVVTPSVRAARVILSSDEYSGTWFTFLVDNMIHWCDRSFIEQEKSIPPTPPPLMPENNSAPSDEAPTAFPEEKLMDPSEGNGSNTTNVKTNATHAGDSKKKRKLITIVSTGWKSGCNFRITDTVGLVASHHSLLKTKYSGRESGSSSSDHSANGHVNSGKKLVEEMKAMLPRTVKLAIDCDETSDRLISFSRNGVSFTSCLTSAGNDRDKRLKDPSLHPLSSPMRKLADFLSRPPVVIQRGPHIVNLGSKFVEVGVSASGFGLITCKIYSIPMQASHDDIACLDESELKYLTLLGEITKQCRRQVNAFFKFSELREYSAYCIVAEPSPNQKHVACIKTFGGRRDSINSIMLCPLPPRSMQASSAAMTKLIRFVDRSERAAVSINVVEVDLCGESGAPDSEYSNDEIILPSADVRGIEQRARVTVSFFTGFRHGGIRASMEHLNTVKWHRLVDINIVDQFCKLTPRDSSAESCVYALLDAIETVAGRPDIATVSIISPVPFAPYLHRKDVQSSWVADGSFASTHSDGVLKLLNRIFAWKQGGLGGQTRDCVIFTVMDVRDVHLISIQKKPKLETNKRVRLQRMSSATSLKRGRTRTLSRGDSNKSLNSDKDRVSFTGGNVSIRNVLLPARILSGTDPVFHVFADNTQYMSDTIQYEVIQARKMDPSVQVMYPRGDLYGEALLPSGEPIIYTLEVSSQNINESERDKKSYNSNLHGVVVRMTVHDLDNFRVTLGPVVGKVTETTATIVVEMNSDLPLVRCQLISSLTAPEPTGELVPSFELVNSAKAGHVVRYDFSKLTPGIRYHVCFPDLMPNRIIGSFQTLVGLPRYAQLAFVGQNVISVKLPVISNLFEAAASYQLPNSRHSEVLNILAESSATANNNGATSWKYLKYYLIQLQSQTSAVLHVGSHSLLAQAFNKAIKPLLDRIFTLQKVALGNIKLSEEVIDEDIVEYDENGEPIRPITAVEKNKGKLAEVVKSSFLVTYFADEIQLLVKEIFRVLWNVPELQQVLANGSQIPLFHNDYHTPFSADSLGRLSQDVDVDMLVQAADMIQDYVRKYSQVYVLNIREELKNKDTEYQHYDTHYFCWRKGTLAVLSLDLAKNRTSDNFQENEFNKEERYRAMMTRKMEAIDGSSDSSYTPGFFDRKQWNNIKDILVDKFVTQLVISTQYPLVGLNKIPQENSFNRDDPTLVSIPFLWEPTDNDLFTFFQMLIKWLDPKRSFGVSRTVVLVSTALIAYHTTVMDMRTGLLIHQICLPNMSVSGNSKQADSLRNTAVMSGRIKKMKYHHRFHGMDNFRLDSSRLGASRSSGSYDASDPSLSGPETGFGLLKVWFDSWKAVGDWSMCHGFPGSLQGGYSAVLTVGPVLGMPFHAPAPTTRRITSSDVPQVMVPVLIEVDRDVDIILEIVNIFSCAVTTVSVDNLVANIPRVVHVGPLDINSRFNCCFKKGILNADDHKFVLQTSSHLEDTNVAVINVELKEEKTHCSDFIFDLVNRCSLPFNGINAIVHINTTVPVNHIRNEFINLATVCQYFRELDSIEKPQLLQAKRKENILTDEILLLFNETIKRIREEYRLLFSRPSYRELLKCVFNMFTPKHNIQEINAMRQKDESYSEANYMFDLLEERVRQEYFDQLSMAPNVAAKSEVSHVFRGMPSIQHSVGREELEEDEGDEGDEAGIPSTPPVDDTTESAAAEVDAVPATGEGVSADNDIKEGEAKPSTPKKTSLFETDGLPDEYVPLAETIEKSKKIAEAKKVIDPLADRVKDKTILRVPKIRYPPLYFTPVGMDPVEAVFLQWQKNILEPGVCAYPAPWTSLNNRLRIECLPPPNKKNSREVIDEYSESNLESGVRLVVLFGSAVEDVNGPGGLFDPEVVPARLFGLRIQRWMNLWLDQKIDRNVVFICPSVQDGNINMNLTLDASPLKESQRRLSVELLGSIYTSNQQEILNLKKEQQVRNKKPKQGSGNLSRARLKAIDDARKVQEARDLLELQNAFKTFTPDGFCFVECKHATIDIPKPPPSDSESRPMSKAEERKAAKEAAAAAALLPTFTVESRAWVRRICSLLDGQEEEARLIESGDFSRPGPTDFLQLPDWFLKYFPVNNGAFVQDEIPLMLRQDPTARALIVLLEDESIHDSLRQLYESSRLSELSRPTEQREVDMTLEGTTELLLRELGDFIWKDILTNELRSHMSMFCDDFVRCVCLAHALGSSTADVAFKSGKTFATVLQRCLILCFQMFLAYKIHTLPQYSYLLSTDEFPVVESDSEPEEEEDDYMSDKDEDMDREEKAEELSPLKKLNSEGEAAAAAEEEGDAFTTDPVLKLKARRQKRNRFYGSKISFMFVKQQK